MLLAIDSGNTNIVFAVFGDDGAVLGEWRSSTNANRTADEFGIWLQQLLQLQGLSREDINASIIATVVPATLFSLKTLCRKYFNCEPLVVGDEGVDIGIAVHVDRPDEVGADRLVNALAAHEKHGGPLIIVDFGTATTFDIIDENGGYVGGVIAPGVNLSSEALHQAAAQLPRVAVERPQNVIGTSTVPAMQSGIFWGYISLIEGLVKRIQKERNEEMDVIATGGLAPLFTQSTDVIRVADDELILRGLLAIYRRNNV
jgi:type III pantothenate kinase